MNNKMEIPEVNKGVWLAFLLLHAISTSNAQKKLITYDTYKEWTNISGGGLSNNGSYVYYSINNESNEESTFFLKSTIDNWQSSYENLRTPLITNDSKFLIGMLSKDSMLILNLISREREIVTEVSAYNIFTSKGNDILVYTTKNDRTLCLKNLNDNSNKSVPDIDSYERDINGPLIVVRQFNKDKKITKLGVVNILSNEKKICYEGENIQKVASSPDGTRIAFISQNDELQTLWLYTIKGDKLTKLMDDNDRRLKNRFRINPENFQFSNDGRYVYFSVTPIRKKLEKEEVATIWNYQDAYLRSFYNGNDYVNTESYLSSINIATNEFKQLLGGTEKIITGTNLNDVSNYIIIESTFGMEDETFIKSSRITYYLCNLKTGDKEILEKQTTGKLYSISISPTEKYVVYYDPGGKVYKSYNIKTKKKCNISQSIHEPFGRQNFISYPNPEKIPVGVAGWVQGDNFVLIHSMYNLWSIDPSGSSSPTNLTNLDYKQQIVNFSIPTKFKKDLKWGKEIILTGFDIKTKKIGLYKISLRQKTNTELLCSLPCYIDGLENANSSSPSQDFIFSKDGRSCLVLFQTSTNAPNYYFSKNLSEFRAMSNIQPHRNFNWLAAQLCNYSDSSGESFQAILYKPEDFDSTKSYPVLINYYTDKSNQFYQYPSVNLPGEDFSIPIAVSNGYLVILPDIKSKIGMPGEGALNSIKNAVKYLSQFSWVDTSRIGIAGHSFGGFETNYIITHSKLFKAAISGAGYSDLIGQSLDIWEGLGLGFSKSDYYKNSAPKMGKGLFDAADAYISNSPILRSQEVTTPLLLMHNTNDQRVPFQQTRQFFIALRSLQKPVWWLNYENDFHTITNEDNKLDYNKKAMEFFNFYLKLDEEPAWMKRHISANRN